MTATPVFPCQCQHSIELHRITGMLNVECTKCECHNWRPYREPQPIPPYIEDLVREMVREKKSLGRRWPFGWSLIVALPGLVGLYWGRS